MKNIKLILLTVVIYTLLFAWWFRYDTHCGGNGFYACVSYDRFTGTWINPIKEAKKNEN